MRPVNQHKSHAFSCDRKLDRYAVVSKVSRAVILSRRRAQVSTNSTRQIRRRNINGRWLQLNLICINNEKANLSNSATHTQQQQQQQRLDIQISDRERLLCLSYICSLAQLFECIDRIQLRLKLASGLLAHKVRLKNKLKIEL